MRMKIITVALLVGAVMQLAGCATPARAEQMTISGTDANRYHGQTPLANKVAVAAVNGGSETNPLWTSEIGAQEFQQALKNSLHLAQLLAEGEASKYLLTANMVDVDQPMVGFDMEVTTTIHYRLVRQEDMKLVFEQSIQAPFTATMSDAFMGVERLKLANEGAARENIRRLIDRLYQLDIQLSDIAVK